MTVLKQRVSDLFKYYGEEMPGDFCEGKAFIDGKYLTNFHVVDFFSGQFFESSEGTKEYFDKFNPPALLLLIKGKYCLLTREDLP